ncbi:unnamed protein product [Lactuca virosa]|uniref:Uncharacterized protein n=1 Tax=Lactuca virosa TaxID=75947 RepID=A0AAU9LN11_9ASTR|nr:unnamed protein product [Lactuca virosa]
MLESMNQIRCGHCIVKVNIAKYGKKPTHMRHVQTSRKDKQVEEIRHAHTGGWKKIIAGRSFAEAVSGKNNTPSPSPNPVVHLHRVAAMEYSALLLGEVKCFQHLSNLPKLLNADGEIPCRVYYAGGLKVVLKFFFHEYAMGYLKNDHIWNR